MVNQKIINLGIPGVSQPQRALVLDVAPPEEAERDKVVSWFMLEGLGKGSAGNKAATYLLLASQEPNEAPRTGQKAQKVGSAAPHAVSGKSKSPKPDAGQPKSSRQNNRKIVSDNLRDDPMPLNVNVQIHISADAGSEQIESIFRAMRKYLHDAPES